MENESKRDPIRSMTQLSLDWLAKRVRKARNIRERIHNGQYDVKSQEVARRLVHDEEIN